METKRATKRRWWRRDGKIEYQYRSFLSVATVGSCGLLEVDVTGGAWNWVGMGGGGSARAAPMKIES